MPLFKLCLCIFFFFLSQNIFFTAFVRKRFLHEKNIRVPFLNFFFFCIPYGRGSTQIKADTHCSPRRCRFQFGRNKNSKKCGCHSVKFLVTSSAGKGVKGSREERKLKEERGEVQGKRSDRKEKLRSHLIFKLPGDG